MKVPSFPLFLVTVSLVFSSIATAATVPIDVKESHREKYPGATTQGWEMDSNGYWEVKFELDGRSHQADYEPDGSWIDTRWPLSFDELPLAVKNALKDDFGDQDTPRIEAVDDAVRGKFFDVEYVIKGSNLDAEYDEQGRRTEVFEQVANQLVRPIGDIGAGNHGAENMGRLELLIEFAFNFLTIFVFAYVIYYRRHHDHKMMFLLFGFNLFLFPIFLLSASLTAGFGFTIFALLALVRLRSDTFSKDEVAYLLGAVALTFINAMLPARVEFVSSVVVLLTAYIGDHPKIWRGAYQKAQIRYPLEERSHMLDHDFLSARIAREFQVEVNNIEIERVEKKQVRLLVMYRDLPEIREARQRAAKKSWRGNKKGLLPRPEAEETPQAPKSDES